MTGHIGLGHTFLNGGEGPKQDAVSTGLLGADFEQVDGHYRFRTVLKGESWNPGLQAPLAQPGAEVKAGEYLLAINGRPVGPANEVYKGFEGVAGKQTMLPVVTGLAGGGFVVTWQHFVSPTNSEIKAQFYDGAGAKLGGDADGTGIKAQVFSYGFYKLIIGTPAVDTLSGTAADDHIMGLGGNDTLRGLGGTGNALANVITGNASNDTLNGDAGRDTLVGGGGNDRLAGGAGNDILTGGTDADTFVFASAPDAASNLDTLQDFTSRSDKLSFSRTVFTGFAGTGAMSVDAFWSGAGVNAAHDATDRVIYNTTTGALWYDADGTGARAAVQVALLTGTPALAFSDFLIAA